MEHRHLHLHIRHINAQQASSRSSARIQTHSLLSTICSLDSMRAPIHRVLE